MNALELVVAAVLVAIVVSGSFVIACGADYLDCHNKWAVVGPVEWGPLQGCIVTLKNGKRVPADAIRELPQ